MPDADPSRRTDHFSSIAGDYARFRPDYPLALLEWVAAESPARGRAWDCGAGSGQASLALARFFREIVATDLSASQLASAARHERLRWIVARAEAVPLARASCDAVVVAQALHWFDLGAFLAEARRVLVKDGLLAVWSYGLLEVDPGGDASLDALVQAFYHDVLGPHWPAQRRLVDSGYRDLALPAPELAPPPFHMERRWTLAELTGYVGTWSAVQAFRAATGRDPLPEFTRRLEHAWGDARAPRTIRWPLAVRAVRLNAVA